MLRLSLSHTLCKEGAATAKVTSRAFSPLLTMIFFLRFFLRKVKRRRNRLSLGQTTYPLFHVWREQGGTACRVDQAGAVNEWLSGRARERENINSNSLSFKNYLAIEKRPALCLAVGADALGIRDSCLRVDVDSIFAPRNMHIFGHRVGLFWCTQANSAGRGSTSPRASGTSLWGKPLSLSPSQYSVARSTN